MVENRFSYQRQSCLKRRAVFYLWRSSPMAGSVWGRQQLPLTQKGICWTTRAVTGWQLPLPDGPCTHWSCFMARLFKHLKDHVSWAGKFTSGCFWDRLLQYLCQNLYPEGVFFNLTLFFGFKWWGQEVQGQLPEKQGEQLWILHSYCSHFWKKAKTHVRVSINNQCLSELETPIRCLLLRVDYPFNSHLRLSCYHAFTKFCYISYWKEIRTYSDIKRSGIQ